MNVLKRCQIFLAKSYDAINDSVNLSRDNLEQNKYFKKFIGGPVNRFATNYEYTRSNLLNLLYIQENQNSGISRRFLGQRVSEFNSMLNFRSISTNLLV